MPVGERDYMQDKSAEAPGAAVANPVVASGKAEALGMDYFFSEEVEKFCEVAGALMTLADHGHPKGESVVPLKAENGPDLLVSRPALALLGQLLDVADEKEAAVQDQDFEKAAGLRTQVQSAYDKLLAELAKLNPAVVPPAAARTM